MDELKACPFCGQELTYFGRDRWYGEVVDSYKHPLSEPPCSLDGLIFISEKWNTRPIEDALTAENKKLVMFILNIIKMAKSPNYRRGLSLSDVCVYLDAVIDSADRLLSDSSTFEIYTEENKHLTAENATLCQLITDLKEDGEYWLRVAEMIQSPKALWKVTESTQYDKHTALMKRIEEMGK